MVIKDCKLFDRITPYPYGMYNRVASTSKYKMVNFNDYRNENKVRHNSNWSYIYTELIHINNRSFQIRKNKGISKVNKQSTRY